MRNRLLFFVVACIAISCGQRTENHQHENISDPLETEGNQALYDEVMRIHDEVMPRMNEIFRKKEELKNKIAGTPGMADSERQVIEDDIARLDSAHNGMMVWMRQFNPVTDTADAQAARDYLNDEMVKVERVKTDILSAIEKGKALQ
jgi:Mg2+ and Co2+ transporter CorA